MEARPRDDDRGPGDRSRPGSRRERWVALLFLLLPVGALWKTLFTGGEYGYYLHDNAVQFYAWYQYAITWIGSGRLPLWDMHQWAGTSFIGEMQSGLFYPINWLMFGLGSLGVPLRPLIDLKILIGLVLSQTFTYLLGRHFGLSIRGAALSAIVFTFAGYTFSRISAAFNVFDGAIWLPFVLYFYTKAVVAPGGGERALFAMTAGLGLGLSLLAGHPQPAFHIGMAMVLLAVFVYLHPGATSYWRKARPSVPDLVVGLLVVLVTGGAVAAVQILPAQEYFGGALRWVGTDTPLPATAKIPYGIYGDLFIIKPADVFGLVSPQVARTSDVNPYVGSLPVALALAGIFALGRAPLSGYGLALACLSVLIALGRFSVVSGWFWLVPLADKVREPIRTLYLAHFGIALLAGYGLDWIFRTHHAGSSPSHTVTRRLVLGTVSGLLGVGVMYQLLLGERAHDAVVFHSFVFLMLVLLAFGVVWNLFGSGVLGRPVATIACLGLVVFELLSMSQGVHFAKARDNRYDPGRYYAETPVLRFFLEKSRRDPNYRIWNLEHILPMNAGGVFGLHFVTGFRATTEASYFEFLSQGWEPPATTMRILGARYVVTRSEKATLSLVARYGDVRIYEDKQALPFFRFVARARVAASRAEALRLLSEVDPEREVVLEGSEVVASSADPAAARQVRAVAAVPGESLVVDEHTPGLVRLHTQTSETKFLVVSQKHYPGWRASVDGRPVPVLRAYGVLLALEIPEGQHEIILQYAPSRVLLGGGLGLLAFLVWLGVLGLRVTRFSAHSARPTAPRVEGR